MLSNSEEHREVFPEPPPTAFQRSKNFKDFIVKAKLNNNNNCYERSYSRCQKFRCHVCESMADSNSFHSHVTKAD